MKQINVKQARQLLKLNEPVYLSVGNELQEITKDNLQTSDIHGNRQYFKFDRDTIKMLIQQLMGIDAVSWKYFTNDKGRVLLFI